jgi:hypothetical protein
MTIEYRTVLIGADCATRFEAAVESGVELARVLQLGLAGLFVEEEDLLDFSAFPFSRVIQGRGGARPLDPEAMRKAMRREAERLRAELARLAEQSNLRWRFEIGRGRTSEALGLAARSGDIVVLPTSPSESGLRARLETARALLAQGRAAFLAPERARAPGGAVMVLIDGPARAAALPLAARIAARMEARLVVHAWPEAEDDLQAIRRSLAEAAAGLQVELNARRREDTLAPEALEASAPRLIVSQWSLFERLGLIGPQVALRRRPSGLLLLPDEADRGEE